MPTQVQDSIDVLASEILERVKARGPLDALQIASDMGLLGTSEDLEDDFFAAISRLEMRNFLAWRPITTEVPGADDSSPYTSRVYYMR